MAAAGLIVVLDVAVKQTVMLLMPHGASIPVTPFFNLVHVWNTGAAFSFLAEAGGWQRYLFVTLGIVVCIPIAWLLRRGVDNRLETAAYTLIMGGALGNVVDRSVRGFVVDYLDFHWRGWHWPAFNVADIAITAGALLLVTAAFRSPDGGAATERPQGALIFGKRDNVGEIAQAEGPGIVRAGEKRVTANVKTALLLVFVVVVFFSAVVIRHWLW